MTMLEPVLTDFGWWMPKPGEADAELQRRARDEWAAGAHGMTSADVTSRLRRDAEGRLCGRAV